MAVFKAEMKHDASTITRLMTTRYNTFHYGKKLIRMVIAIALILYGLYMDSSMLTPMICLFIGGLTLFGYLAALVIGGETATAICVFMHKQLMPVVIYVTTALVLLGLVAMYMAGEVALTASAKQKK